MSSSTVSVSLARQARWSGVLPSCNKVLNVIYTRIEHPGASYLGLLVDVRSVCEKLVGDAATALAGCDVQRRAPQLVLFVRVGAVLQQESHQPRLLVTRGCVKRSVSVHVCRLHVHPLHLSAQQVASHLLVTVLARRV